MLTKNFQQAGINTILLFILLVIIPINTGFSQTGGGYINYEEIMLDPLNITLDAIAVQQTPNWSDVKAVGMGKTQLANGRFCNAMLDNPALLSHTNYLYDLFGIQAIFPGATFDAATYVKDNIHQFKDGDFLKLLGDGFKEYYSANTAEGERAAIRKINQALEFPNELLDKIVVDSDDPYVHGMNVIPSVQVQYGNWGFSLYGNAKMGFFVDPGKPTSRLLALQIPENTQDLTVEVLKSLAEIVGSLFDEDGNLSENALPQAFATSNIDIVGAVGRSYRINKSLHLGANLKIINRRFSTKLIKPDNLKDVLKEARSDIKHSATGLTFDIGALYRHIRTGTRFGVSLQNIIPVTTVSSATTFDFVTPVNSYPKEDSYGNPLVGSVDFWGDFYPDPQGDTLLVIEKQEVHAKQPFELKAPILANIGVLHPINRNWDVSFDWVDIFSQDDFQFDKYIERFRIGTEYRLPKYYKLALRGGIADKHLTFGCGIRFKYVQIDAAYARDSYTGNGAFFTQLKFGY